MESPVRVTKSDRERIIFRCREDLMFLCKAVFNYKDWSQVHLDLARFLRKSGNRIHIELPRGHLKSSVVTIAWTIQQILKDPNIRILLVNATWDNSREFLRVIQQNIASGSVLSRYFGEFVSSHWNQDAITVRQRNRVVMGPTIATTGVEKEKTSQHYELIVVDDLVGPENVETPEQRRKVHNYFMSLFDLLEPNGRIVVIGTRYHQDDLYAKILEENQTLNNWSLFIKSCYKEDGSILFPEKFTEAVLNEKRARGTYHFASQYLNNPIDESSADFKKDQIHFYSPGSEHPSHLYMAVDPAMTLGKDADFSAAVVGGMFANRKIRVLDFFRKKVVPSDLIDLIFEMVKKWRLKRIGIETFAFQRTLKYEIERKQKETKFFFSVDELTKGRSTGGEPTRNKEARIRSLQPLFEQGLIELRQDMHELVGELLAFPRGRTDDLIDALSRLKDYLIPSPGTLKAQEDDYMTMKWWIKNHMPKPTGNIYERFMADLK